MKGTIKKTKTKTVVGVGINDADYVTSVRKELPKAGGKRRRELVWECPFYRKWLSMLQRCYSPKAHIKHSTYKDCTVCEEWLTFSNFRKWMITQDWEGKELDKDLLVLGNKVYSPETCSFISERLNSFLLRGCNRVSGGLVGTYLCGRDGKYVSSCSNPFSNKQEFLGRFDTEKEAHLAWKKRKYEIACLLVADESLCETIKINILSLFN